MFSGPLHVQGEPIPSHPTFFDMQKGDNGDKVTGGPDFFSVPQSDKGDKVTGGPEKFSGHRPHVPGESHLFEPGVDPLLGEPRRGPSPGRASARQFCHFVIFEVFLMIAGQFKFYGNFPRHARQSCHFCRVCVFYLNECFAEIGHPRKEPADIVIKLPFRFYASSPTQP